MVGKNYNPYKCKFCGRDVSTSPDSLEFHERTCLDNVPYPPRETKLIVPIKDTKNLIEEL